MTGYVVLPAGEAALLVDGLAPGDVLPLYGALRLHPGIVDLVPAESTLLVSFDLAVLSRTALEAAIGAAIDSTTGVRPRRPAGAETGEITLDVRYDGPDLAEAATLLGLATQELVARHAALTWTAAFLGFAPGFAYLTADGDPLSLPRRSTPRPAVPAGSVALGGRYCGAYPRESPGGWHLIGTTDAALWDESRVHPALIAPGTRVRFREV